MFPIRDRALADLRDDDVLLRAKQIDARLPQAAAVDSSYLREAYKLLGRTWHNPT